MDCESDVVCMGERAAVSVATAGLVECVWKLHVDGAHALTKLGAGGAEIVVDVFAGRFYAAEKIAAAGGSDPAMTQTGVGVFCPVSPMANDAGMEALNGPRDLDLARRELREAGYRGERVVFLGATDIPTINAISEVGADLLRRLGMNVDFVATDWGTTGQRRAMKNPPGPCVSCPMTPCLSGMRSSNTRISKPPGRKLDNTASASGKASARSVVVRTVRSTPCTSANRRVSAATSSKRSSPKSTSTTSEPLKFSPCATNEAIVPGARVLPPPR